MKNHIVELHHIQSAVVIDVVIFLQRGCGRCCDADSGEFLCKFLPVRMRMRMRVECVCVCVRVRECVCVCAAHNTFCCVYAAFPTRCVFVCVCVLSLDKTHSSALLRRCGKTVCTFLGTSARARVILWESLSPEDQQKCLNDLQDNKDWVIWCKAKPKDMDGHTSIQNLWTMYL